MPMVGSVLTPGLVAHLQATAGNRAAVHVVRPRPVVQRAVSIPEAAVIAARLYDAMEGLGTDEEAVYGALSGRTPEDIDAIKDAYFLTYDRSLQEDVNDDFSGDELARVNQLLAGRASEAGATPAQQEAGLAERAGEIARHLVEAMEDPGTEEDEIWNALSGRSPDEIRAIKTAYHDLSGHWLDRDFMDELSGDELERALELIGVTDAGTFRERFTEEMMEGFTAAGTGLFEWTLEPEQLRVEVPIKFDPDDGVSAPVPTWNSQIDARWNQFAVIEPGGRRVPINISMRDDPSGFHEVQVHPGTGRANTAEWYVNQRPSTAPHEFGHLIGLPDEYQRSPEDFAAVTGGETIEGPSNESGQTAAEIAVSLHDALYLDDEAARAPAATALLTQVGLIVGGVPQQGQFAQSVRRAYDEEYDSAITRNLVQAMRARLPEGDRWMIQTVFSFASRTVMGGAEGLYTGPQPHDHSVEPRHLRSFVAIVRDAWPSYEWTVGPK